MMEHVCHRTFGVILILFGIIFGKCFALESLVCEPDWSLGDASGESCYRFASMEEQSHSNAVQACASMDASLVAPSSEAEFDEFRDRTDVESTDRGFSWTQVWMGCGDEENEGQYVCEDGIEISEDSDWWGLFQPNNFLGQEDCIVYMRESRKLRDVSCDDEIAFVLCEKPAKRLFSRPVLKETTLRRKYNIGSLFEDYCLSNHVIYSISARSVGRCASACSARDDCLSFTYEGGSICEMNDVTEGQVAGSFFVQRSGCVYYEKI